MPPEVTPQEHATLRSMRLVGIREISYRELQMIRFLQEKKLKPYDKVSLGVKQNGGWTVRVTKEDAAEFE